MLFSRGLQRLFAIRLASVFLLLLLVGCSGAGLYGRESPSPYERQVQAYKAEIAGGTLPNYPVDSPARTQVAQVEDPAIVPLAPTFHEFLSPEEVAALDMAKFWWTDTPRPRRDQPASMFLVITNTTDKPLHGVNFRLSDEACGTQSQGIATDLKLPAPLAPASKAAVNFQIDISKDNGLRRNRPACGQISQAW
jgi:hypothetical protein